MTTRNIDVDIMLAAFKVSKNGGSHNVTVRKYATQFVSILRVVLPEKKGFNGRTLKHIETHNNAGKLISSKYKVTFHNGLMKEIKPSEMLKMINSY